MPLLQHTAIAQSLKWNDNRYIKSTDVRINDWHLRQHNLLTVADHADVATYLNQAVLNTSSPTFANVNIPTTGYVGLSSGAAKIVITDAAPDRISFQNCWVGVGTDTPTSSANLEVYTSTGVTGVTIQSVDNWARLVVSSASSGSAAAWEFYSGRPGLQDFSIRRQSVEDYFIIRSAGYVELHLGIIVNESGDNSDTRIEGDTDQYLLFCDASSDRVSIGFDLINPILSKMCINGGLNIGDWGAVADNCLNVVSAATIGTTLTMSGGNIILGSNYLSGDGGNEGVSVSAAGVVSTSGNLSVGGNVLLNGHYLSNDGGDEGISIDNSGNVTSSGTLTSTSYYVSTNKVVGARETGWVTSSGTATKDQSGIDVDTITASDANIRLIGGWLKGITGALLTHGLIGPTP